MLSYQRCIIRRITINLNESPLFQQLRYKRKEKFRKPIWDPVAPSKYFRVRQKREYDDVELEQRRLLIGDTLTNRKSIWKYFSDEFYLPTLEAGGFTPEQVRDEEREQIRLIQENRVENERVAELRMKRLQMEADDVEADLIVKGIKKREEMRVMGEVIDERVKQEIIRSESYITRETLDSAIEEALHNPVHYDYAIDSDGNVYYDGALHPYAFTPSAVPETSSNTKEFVKRDEIRVKFKPSHLF